MGLLEQEINELRNLRRDFRNKKYDASHVNTEIAIFSQIEKRAKLSLQAFALGAKFKNGVMQKIFNSNLLSDGTSIDLGQHDPEADKIKCPLQE